MQFIKDFIEQRAKDRQECFEKPNFYKWSERFKSEYDNDYGARTELSFLIQYITGQKLNHYTDSFGVLQNILEEQSVNKDPNINWCAIYEYFDKRQKTTDGKIGQMFATDNVNLILHTLEPYREKLTKKYATF